VISIVPVVSLAAQEPEGEFFVGRPFGVGKMTLHFDKAPALPLDSPVWFTEKDNRALYPVFERTGMRVSTTQHATGPTSLTAYFLFRGDEPLRVGIVTDMGFTWGVEPTKDDDAHDKLLRAWWSRYTAAARNVAASGAYQPLMENYLTNMLGRRLGLDATKLPLAFSRYDAADKFLAVMTGAESVRIAAQADVLLEKDEAVQPADQPLPKPVQSPPVRFPTLEDKIEIEPIADHVPVECFYVRCGSFANFSWLRKNVDQWGGKVRQIASVRGLDYGLTRRIERQLALRETALTKLLGGTVVSDVAIIGTDTFLREGAAIGVIFETRSDAALRLQITQQRQETLAAESDASQRIVEIHDQKVSLLSTPGNEVRSFWAVDGKYHLVTTSQTIARRFLEAGQGKGSLGHATEFRWARTIMPVADNHTVFTYLSDPFFRQLVSPHYRVEMTRRTRAAGEGDLVQLAQLAASAEGSSAKTIDQLVAGGFLPETFGNRPDGSSVVLDGDRMVDSLRGAYGSFLPVPDVEIEKVTLAERNAYDEFARMYARLWRRMDPTIIGLKRRVLDNGKKERLIFDVHITPYAREHYGMIANWLPKADEKRWAVIPGDIALAEVNILGQKYVLGVRDCVPHFAIRDGKVHYSGPRDDDAPLYLAVSDPGKTEGASLNLLGSPVGDPGTKDESGNVRVTAIFGEAWMRARAAVAVVAFKKKILDEVVPHAEFVPAERSAKARLRVGDLASTGVAASINAEGYIRARKVSAGNVFLFHALMQQLHISGDDVQDVAEQLLHARPICPLGGEYKLAGGFTNVNRWQSTAWKGASLYRENHVPKGFRTPLLDWLAGLSLEFNIDNTTLSTHIELDVRPGDE
jgi:hypothetical protein